MNVNGRAATLEQRWATESRWKGIERRYDGDAVRRLAGSVHQEHTLARLGAERLWESLHGDAPTTALGVVTGNQAVQAARAGLAALYCSGWQVAADGNLAGEMYPDQSLYPVNSVPAMVERLNNALTRLDQIESLEGRGGAHWYLPVVADGEAGFGGALNVFELTKAMIKAGAAGVHFEDQLSSEKKCGHLGGKVLIPTQQAIRHLIAARLAADVLDVPTIIIARTDAGAAKMVTSDADARDRRFLTGERTPEGFFNTTPGIEASIERAIAYAPYADLLWMETSEPNVAEAEHFAQAVRAKHPGKMLAYNCSPSFNWRKKLDAQTIARFRGALNEMGYKFQFVTLAGFHAINYSFFKLAYEFNRSGMTAYADFQAHEFADESLGYTATRHQREVGTGYFDEVAEIVGEGKASTTALHGSTERDQFYEPQAKA
ncbi:MAG: isocitrate lyase [Candidatus Eremiobacteraeota bacterium]|nr:isocitrate lyase [Candidatus Eremiobacteraeota bacterium]MBV9700446.1 isocitrate lyase [Candidatus Eremiobacteraeota bacterium]